MSTFHQLAVALAGVPAADFAGAAGVLLGSSWALFEKRRTILCCQALGSSCFAAHYLLLGSATAAVACLMSVLQSTSGAAMQRSARLAALYAASYLVILATAYASWHGLPSLFAAVASLFAALGRWQTNPQRMRLVFLVCSANWVMHNALVGTPFGLTSDTLAISTILFGLYRNRRRSPQRAIADAFAWLSEQGREAQLALRSIPATPLPRLD